jgi:Zn-dependent peptidase ImmA (M78 family)
MIQDKQTLHKVLNFATKVQSILKDNNLKSPPINVFNIAHNEGIDLKYLPKKKVSEQGVEGELSYAQRKRQWVIHFNGNATTTGQRFTVAHELGHYFVHKQTYQDSSESMYRDVQWNLAELQANQFAGELLMPVEMVIKEGEKIVDHVKSRSEFISRMAYTFMVSQIAMRYRLQNLGILLAES